MLAHAVRIRRPPSCHDRVGRRAWAVVLAGVALASPSINAADDASPPAAPFQPDDISIGEPIALPFAKPAASAGGTVASTAVAPPVGWLGMAVAESNVVGRWSIVEVTADGPAAAAGIRIGDDLRAINGSPLRNADEVAQALTAIGAGQQVRLAVARADEVKDVVLVAVPRPTATARDPQWQSSTQPPVPVPVPPAPAPPAPTASVLTSPPPRATTPAASAAPPAAAPATPTAPAGNPLAVAPRSSPPAVAAAAPRPLPPVPPAGGGARGRTALGVRTVPIDADMQARFRLPEPAGAYVVGVVGDLPASKAGIPPGSVIVALGDRPVRSPQDLSQLVASGPVDRPLPLQYVLPGGAGKRAEVILQSLERPLEEALVGDDPLRATAAPTLEPGPGPRVARRPPTPPADETGELRRELGQLRSWLDVLEKRLEKMSDRTGR